MHALYKDIYINNAKNRKNGDKTMQNKCKYCRKTSIYYIDQEYLCPTHAEEQYSIEFLDSLYRPFKN